MNELIGVDSKIEDVGELCIIWGVRNTSITKKRDLTYYPFREMQVLMGQVELAHSP